MCDMSFLQKVTGHDLRMHNPSRVLSNSVGIMFTLGMLSSLCDKFPNTGGVGLYRDICAVHSRVAELVRESERTLDRALWVGMDKSDAEIFPFVQAILLIAEDTQRMYLDKLHTVGQDLPTSLPPALTVWRERTWRFIILSP